MPVGRRRLVNRPPQIQVLDNRPRPQIEMLPHQPLNPVIGDLPGVESFHRNRNRLRHPDSVGNNHFHPLRQPRRHQIFGDIPRRISPGAVNLRRILPRKRPPAMPRNPPVGVHQNLAPGQPGVSLRPAHREPAARIDEIPRVVIQQPRRHNRTDNVFDNIAPNLAPERLPVSIILMLRTDHHRIHPPRLPLMVLHRHLRLAVRPQIIQQPGLPHRRQPLHQPVRQIHRKRHQPVGFVAGKTHHHPLVARPRRSSRVRRAAPPFLQRRRHPAANIRRLLANVSQNAARIPVNPVSNIGIPNLPHHPPGNVVKVERRLGSDFPGDHHQILGSHRLAGDPAPRIPPQRGIQHRIRNLVAQLVRVTLGHRLRGKQVLGRCHKLNGHRVVPQ